MYDKASVANEIRALGLVVGTYVMIGGSGLALRGIRETRDIDVVVRSEIFSQLVEAGWELDPAYEARRQRQRIKRGSVEIYPDMYLNAEQRFVDLDELIASAELVDGIPCLSLDWLRRFKSGDQAQEKDRDDVRLIDGYLQKGAEEHTT